MDQMKAGPFSIGSDIWPGISKLAEESGEVVQVIGKIIGAYPSVEHWDGTNLRDRLAQEIGDLIAAVAFVQLHCNVDLLTIKHRSETKLAMFEKWHSEQH